MDAIAVLDLAEIDQRIGIDTLGGSSNDAFFGSYRSVEERVDRISNFAGADRCG